MATSTEAGQDLYAALLRIAREDGFSVVPDAQLRPGVNGEADLVARSIRLAAGLSEDHRARTLAHELAHALLHAHGDRPREEQEAEAEGVAFVVTAWAGLDTSAYSFAYVADWAGRKDGAALIRRVGFTIQRTAASIIGRLAPEETSQSA